MGSIYYLFKTDMGWVGIAGMDGRIAHLVLPRPARSEAESALRGGISVDCVETKHDFSGEAGRLQAYFAGEPVNFECTIDHTGAGRFDVQVWDSARAVGYGEARSYGWIAERIGRPGASRAVGGALGRNPVPVIVPCHRILRSDGRLGGFSAGLDWKVRLLSLERIGNR